MGAIAPARTSLERNKHGGERLHRVVRQTVGGSQLKLRDVEFLADGSQAFTREDGVAQQRLRAGNDLCRCRASAPERHSQLISDLHSVRNNARVCGLDCLERHQPLEGVVGDKVHCVAGIDRLGCEGRV